MSQTLSRNLTLSFGDAPYDIRLDGVRVGSDLFASVTGGTRAHIGAVSLAEPVSRLHPVSGERIAAASGENAGESAAGDGAAPYVSTLTAAGHKDAVLAELFARALCRAYDVNVCVTAGVHVDDASPEEIALMMRNAESLLEKIRAL